MKPNYNNNNRNNNRKRNNYFTQNIQRDGEYFIEKKMIQQLQNDAIRIFRELAKGDIDVNEYYGYLAHPTLSKVLNDAAIYNLIKYTEVLSALDFKIAAMSSYQQQVPQETINIREEYRCKHEVYNAIYYNIQNFIITKDANFIIAMIDQTRKYRRYI